MTTLLRNPVLSEIHQTRELVRERRRAQAQEKILDGLKTLAIPNDILTHAQDYLKHPIVSAKEFKLGPTVYTDPAEAIKTPSQAALALAFLTSPSMTPETLAGISQGSVLSTSAQALATHLGNMAVASGAINAADLEAFVAKLIQVIVKTASFVNDTVEEHPGLGRLVSIVIPVFPVVEDITDFVIAVGSVALQIMATNHVTLENIADFLYDVIHVVGELLGDTAPFLSQVLGSLIGAVIQVVLAVLQGASSLLPTIGAPLVIVAGILSLINAAGTAGLYALVFRIMFEVISVILGAVTPEMVLKVLQGMLKLGHFIADPILEIIEKLLNIGDSAQALQVLSREVLA